jgi:hypothetical protein
MLLYLISSKLFGVILIIILVCPMRPDVRMWRDTQGHTRAISEIRLVLSGTINPDI